MADRPVLRRRVVVAQPAAKAPAPVAKKAAKPVVEEVDDEEVEEEIPEEEIPEEDDDEEEAPVVIKKAVVPPAVKKVAAVAPVAKKAAPAPEPEDDDEETEPVKKVVKVKPVNAELAGANMLELLAGMTDGTSLVITKIADNKWLFANEMPKAAKPEGLRGNAYWTEVLDEEYLKWYHEWQSLTHDERIKKAKKAGVTWKEDKDPRVNIMRATDAYRTAMGIEKYKPEFRTRSARARLQGR